MSSQIKFRYTNAKDIDVVSFDGMSIKLEAFKRLVVVKKGLIAGVDLVVTDENDKEYGPDDNILKDSSVVVKPRVGYVGTIDAKATVSGDFSGDNVSQMSSVTSANTFMAKSDFAKLAAIAQGPISGGVGTNTNESLQSIALKYSYRVATDADPNAPAAGRLHHRFEGQGMVAMGSSSNRGEKPAPNYICFGCQAVGDHWKADCPYLRGSRNTAPGFENMDTAVPRITPVSANPLFVARKDLFEQRIVGPTTSQASTQRQIPESLKCFICNGLLQDAVLLPCCETPACDECARKSILEGDHRCPKSDCRTPLKIDDIHPFHFLRKGAIEYLKSLEESSAPPPPVRPDPLPVQPPLVMQASAPSISTKSETTILSSDAAAAVGWGTLPPLSPDSNADGNQSTVQSEASTEVSKQETGTNAPNAGLAPAITKIPAPLKPTTVLPAPLLPTLSQASAPFRPAMPSLNPVVMPGAPWWPHSVGMGFPPFMPVNTPVAPRPAFPVQFPAPPIPPPPMPSTNSASVLSTEDVRRNDSPNRDSRNRRGRSRSNDRDAYSNRGRYRSRTRSRSRSVGRRKSRSRSRSRSFGRKYDRSDDKDYRGSRYSDRDYHYNGPLDRERDRERERERERERGFQDSRRSKEGGGKRYRSRDREEEWRKPQSAEHRYEDRSQNRGRSPLPNHRRRDTSTRHKNPPDTKDFKPIEKGRREKERGRKDSHPHRETNNRWQMNR